MSDTSQGDGWWIASDGKWYAPEQHPDYPHGWPPPQQPAEPPPVAQPQPVVQPQPAAQPQPVAQPQPAQPVAAGAAPAGGETGSGRRGPILIGLGVVALVVVGLIFALTRGGDDDDGDVQAVDTAEDGEPASEDGSAEATTETPEEPAATEEPAPPEEPAATEEPAPTEEPAATEEPVPTATPEPTEEPAPTASENPNGPLVQALADEMMTDAQQDEFSATREEAECWASRVVDGIGPGRLAELGLTPDNVGGIDEYDFSDSEIDTIIDGLEDCLNIIDALAEQLESDFGVEGGQCVANALDGELLRDLFRSSFRNQDPPPEFFQAFVDIAVECGLA